MARDSAQTDAADPAGHRDTADAGDHDPAHASGGDSGSHDGERRPVVDVSPALHSAGHELEDLGFDGVDDSAPVLHDDDTDEVDLDHRVGADIATRGQDHH